MIFASIEHTSPSLQASPIGLLSQVSLWPHASFPGGNLGMSGGNMNISVSKILGPSVHADSKGVTSEKLLSVVARSGGFKSLTYKRAAPRYVT